MELVKMELEVLGCDLAAESSLPLLWMGPFFSDVMENMVGMNDRFVAGLRWLRSGWDCFFLRRDGGDEGHAKIASWQALDG